MLGTSPDVAAECFPGAVAEGCGTLAPSLAQDERHILVEVQVLKRDPDEFSDPEAGVQEEAEDRRITSLLEPAALAGSSTRVISSVVKRGTGCSGTAGGLILTKRDCGISSSCSNQRNSCCRER